MSFSSSVKSFLFKVPVMLMGKLFVGKNKYINVIYYHDVVAEEGDGVAMINEQVFFDQMKYLADNGYKTYTFDDLHKNDSLCLFDKKSILITFDDGWLSNYTRIFDFMKNNNLKYNVFLAVGLIGNDKDHLDWEMVKEMHESGIVGFGMHTYNHIAVNDIDNVDKEQEFVFADKIVSEKLNTKTEGFCYPFGYYSLKSNEYLSKIHGYKYIFTSDRLFSYSQNNAVIFGRNAIDTNDDLKMFKYKVKGYYNFMSLLRKSDKIKN